MIDRAIGVIGSRYESAVRDKVFIRVESFDAVDFKIDGKCRELTDTWNVQTTTADSANGIDRIMEKGIDVIKNSQ